MIKTKTTVWTNAMSVLDVVSYLELIFKERGLAKPISYAFGSKTDSDVPLLIVTHTSESYTFDLSDGNQPLVLSTDKRVHPFEANFVLALDKLIELVKTDYAGKVAISTTTESVDVSRIALRQMQLLAMSAEVGVLGCDSLLEVTTNCEQSYTLCVDEANIGIINKIDDVESKQVWGLPLSVESQLAMTREILKLNNL